MDFKYGNVSIEIKGCSPEKFINIAARRNIFFKNIKYLEKNKLRGDVDFDGFKKLRPVALKSRCKMRILKKRGWIFYLKKLLYKKVFVIEGAVSLIILLLLSFIIGYVEIKVPDGVSQEKIIAILNENGVHEGVLRFNIDDELLTKKLLVGYPELSWAEIKIEGTHLLIDAAKSIPKPHIVPYTVPCDIIAGRSGIIYSMNIKNGTALFEVGDTVTEGDIIVSGVMKNRFDDTKHFYVHSHGDILAKTWYTSRQVVNTFYVKKIQTGNYFENSRLQILGLNLGFNKSVTYENYEVTTSRKNIILFNSIRLPISIMTENYYEYVEEAINIDGDTALKNAEREAYNKCISALPPNAEILDVKITYEPMPNGGLCVVAAVECIENIAVETDFVYEEPLTLPETSESGE